MVGHLGFWDFADSRLTHRCYRPSPDGVCLPTSCEPDCRSGCPTCGGAQVREVSREGRQIHSALRRRNMGPFGRACREFAADAWRRGDSTRPTAWSCGDCKQLHAAVARCPGRSAPARSRDVADCCTRGTPRPSTLPTLRACILDF